MEKSIYKSTFLEWVDSTSVHGLPNFFRVKFKSLKIIWFISFLTSTCLCFVLIASSIANYLNFEVTTKIRIIDKGSLIFPTVTVCNSNLFVTNISFEYVKKYLIAINITDLENSSLLESYFKSDMNQLFKNYIFVKYLMSLNIYKQNPESEIKKNLGYSFDQMFLACIFGTIDCNKSDWVPYYDLNYGNCFKFNSGFDSNGNKIPIKTINQTGKMYGLMLELFVKEPDIPLTLNTYSGAHIFIHNESFMPITWNGIDVEPGKLTNIALQRYEITQLETPYSDCIKSLDSIDSFDSDLYKKTINFNPNKKYRQSDCFDLFLQESTLNKCKCQEPISLIKNSTVRICAGLGDLLCGYKVYYEAIKDDYKMKIKEKCPLECNTVSYSYSQSYGKYPSKSYANDLVKSKKIKNLFGNESKISLENLRESVLAINIYYEDLKQTEITESPSMSWDILISGIGGTLGLFLGMSFLSFVEFLEIGLHLFYIRNDSKVDSFK